MTSGTGHKVELHIAEVRVAAREKHWAQNIKMPYMYYAKKFGVYLKCNGEALKDFKKGNKIIKNVFQKKKLKQCYK